MSNRFIFGLLAFLGTVDVAMGIGGARLEPLLVGIGCYLCAGLLWLLQRSK